MKRNLKYTLFLFFMLVLGRAQTKQLTLAKAGCQLFRGNIYCYGIVDQKSAAAVCIYKLDAKLNILDSFLVKQEKSIIGDFLQLYSDTLHDYLNIYLQKKDKKEVSILRFTKKFELIANISHVDIPRLNNTSLFSGESLYYQNSVYSVKTEQDSSGKQFYLNKYQLKSETENFDYTFKWQFPFERKNIHSAHVFYANKTNVFLFVTISDGSRAGQWILNLLAESGKLLKATKLNEKGETNAYEFGCFFTDKNYRSLHLAGQKFSEAQFSRKESKPAISNAPFINMYYLEVDSLGEIVKRQDLKIPVTNITSGAKKTSSSFLLKCYQLSKHYDGSLTIEADIFKSTTNSLCYFYSNSLQLRLTPSEDKLLLEKTAIAPNLLIESYYVTPDKLDLNGKLCADSLLPFEKLFYASPTFPVKLAFKSDPEKNPLWILSKHTFKKNQVNYSFLRPVKKIYLTSTIAELNEAVVPAFTVLSSENFIISSQPEERKYQLDLYSW